MLCSISSNFGQQRIPSYRLYTGKPYNGFLRYSLCTIVLKMLVYVIAKMFGETSN